MGVKEYVMLKTMLFNQIKICSIIVGQPRSCLVYYNNLFGLVHPKLKIIP